MKRVLRLLPYVVAWTLFCVLTLLTPLYADDFGNLAGYYRLSPLEPGQFPTLRTFLGAPDCLGNLLSLTWHHWHVETGRYTAAFLLRVATGMPHWLFAVMNATIWTALWWMLCRLLGVSRRWVPFVLAIGVAGALVQDACLWASGACNYLWPMTALVAAAMLFVRPRMGESVFAWRNLWMILLVPGGFILAGGHELLSLSGCLALGVYWLRELFWRRSFTVNGRLLLTVGLGLGALAVVFAPGTLQRAGGGAFFVPDSQILFSVARKGMAFLRLCMGNPALVIALVATLFALAGRRLHPLRERTKWVLLIGWTLVAVSCILADGMGRTAWPASMLAIVMAIALAQDLGWGRRTYIHPLLTGLSLIIALSVFVVTACRSASQLATMRATVHAWQNNPDHVAHLPMSDEAFDALAWFDRSWKRMFEWGLGVPWTNSAVAHFYELPFGLMLEPVVWDEVYQRDTFCCPDNRLPCGWYAKQDADVLVLPLPEESGFLPGQAAWGKPEYKDLPPRLSSIARIRKRILREGFASFSVLAPEQEMHQGTRLSGFVLGTSHGNYVVLRHNRHIPREAIGRLSLMSDADKK